MTWNFTESSNRVFWLLAPRSRVADKTGWKIGFGKLAPAFREGQKAKIMASANSRAMFPCPVCMKPREVRMTKKAKPCLTCDPCGIQLFIRGPAGIEEFHRLLEGSMRQDVLSRLKEMEQRYRLNCPECGSQFWIEPKLVKTSVFDGSLQRFRCPQKNCRGIVKWERSS